MSQNPEALRNSPEPLIVALARTGDSAAFAELVRRRQAWVRTLLRRCCGDITLADDLAQQAFLKAWQDIGSLRNPKGFATWLRTLAINVWRQHVRKHDALADSDTRLEVADPTTESSGLKHDLSNALARLAPTPRLCVVLSYHEGLSHKEIAETTGLALGTVKSHIRRGTEVLQSLLAAYDQRKELAETT